MLAVSDPPDHHRRHDLPGPFPSPLPFQACRPTRRRVQQFNGQHGRAYLFERAVNTILGPAEDRPMTTGMHTVRDVMCAKCEATLGWKYERAFEQSQKYKEGKVILEKALLVDVQ